MTDRRDPTPKTVIRGTRPVDTARDGVAEGRLAGLAQPIIALARRAERDPRPNARAIAAEARGLIDAFDREAARSDLSAASITAAREALFSVLDARVRTNPALPARDWRAALRAAVPAHRPRSAAALKADAATAERGGPTLRDLARFLATCAEAVEVASATAARSRGPRARPLGILAAGAALLALAGWACLAEWRFREGLVARIPDIDRAIAAGRSLPVGAEAAQLDALAATARSIEADAPRSPLGLIARLPALDPARIARAGYARAAEAALAEPLGEALGAALATEGEPSALYDSLRAWQILSGHAPWQTSYVVGWARDRAAAYPDLRLLSAHLPALAAPPAGLAAPDPESLSESRRIAAESRAEDRAFVELRRAEATAALPDWTPPPDVAGLGTVLARRSGAPVFAGLAGLYTAAGWAYARDGGIDAAVATAAAQSASLLPDAARAPAARDAVLSLLQRRTLDTWTGWLSDLRVRALSDQPTAMLITGTLAARSSPLSALFTAVWREVGGEDRSRSHADQLRIAAELGPAIQFVQQGRMADIAQLFAGLNVTLASVDRRMTVEGRRLLDIEGRAQSILALSQAPPLVAGIIEDVLAQSAVSRQDVAAAEPAPELVAPDGPAPPSEPPPLPAETETPAPALATDPRDAAFAGACRAAVAGRYPFAEGPDADLAAVAALFGPDGLVRRSYGPDVAQLIDTTRSPWTWKPEARLSGRQPESAAFLQRAFLLGDALFGAGGAPASVMTLVALAQRGAATVGLGGRSVPVATTGGDVSLSWPGPEASGGFAVSMDAGGGVRRRAAPGPWGLMRVLDGVRLRAREDGRRFLLDVREADARVYVEMRFASPLNPVTARALMKGLVCPDRL